MKIEDCKVVHGNLTNGQEVDAANFVLSLLGKPASVTKKAQAIPICQSLFQHLVDNDLYLHAAALQWSDAMFNTEPESSVRVFESLSKNSKLLLMGASSMGKTFNAGAYYLIDYLRDPLYTSVKLAAINEQHLQDNLFAHVVTLYRACAIPSRYDITIREAALWMGVKEAGSEFGIAGLAFKQSQETSGQFKGYKSKPVRTRKHPRFGFMSRLRVLGDEGQNWPGGPFKDFNSLVASISDVELIKLAVAFNPESVSQHVVRLAEPEQGFLAEDLDRLYDYASKAGWAVCRLDAARCENVKQRKLIYPGLQTYDGYLGYLKSGGDNSPNFWTFARGFPPVSGTVNTIIPPAWPQDARGEATFIETPTTCCAIDLAFMGKDSAQMAVGRWGLASGYRDEKNQFHEFLDRTNTKRAKPHHVLQVDQLIPLQKHDNTTKMAEEIIGRCKMLQISPEWVSLDKTGYGFGTWSHLASVWGDVFGISWNEKATEKKIVAEDLEGADKQCDGVMSEMWWALRKWLEPACRSLLINPIIPTQPIYTQMTSRRMKHGKNGIKVEAKEEYMARNTSSPDETDAIVMLIHLIRKRSDVLPGLVEQQDGKRDNPDMKFQSVSKMTSVDDDDSICEGAPDDDKIEV